MDNQVTNISLDMVFLTCVDGGYGGCLAATCAAAHRDAL